MPRAKGDYSGMLERFDMEITEIAEGITPQDRFTEYKPHELKEKITEYMTEVKDNDNQRILAERMYDQAIQLIQETKGLSPRYEYDDRGEIIESEWVEYE